MSRKNFTAREREKLKTIVGKYKDIIENKSTNAQLIAKKTEAWDTVALEFNSSAEYPRTVKQLLALHNNLKRPTRQDLANENQKEDEILKKIKKDETKDKKEILATGAGTFTPALGAAYAHMMAIMGPQIQPLNNDIDSASFVETVLGEDLHEDASASSEPSKEPTKLTQNSTKKKPKTIIRLKEKNNEILKTKIYVRKLETIVIQKKEALVKLRIAQKQERLIDMDIKLKEQQLKDLENQAN